MRRPAGLGRRWVLPWLCAAGLTGACSGAGAAGVTPVGVIASSTPPPPATGGLAATPMPRSILTPSVTRQPTVTPWLNQASATPVSGMAEIDVEDYYFYPDTITVTAGTTVRWVPVGSAEHSIVPRNPPDPWPGGATAGLGSPAVEWTFDTPGVYKYFCDYHPGAMDAILIVIEE